MHQARMCKSTLCMCAKAHYSYTKLEMAPKVLLSVKLLGPMQSEVT
jgi:hypothetical protein